METENSKTQTGSENQSLGDADLNKTGDIKVDSAVVQPTDTPAAEEDARLKAAIEQAKDEKTKRQRLEEDNKILQEQIQIIAANRVVQAQVQAQPQQTRQLSAYEQAMKELAIEPEYMSEPDRIKIMARAEEINNQRNSHYVSLLVNQQFINSHKDYNTVVGSNHPVTGQFMMSSELQEILTKKPYLTAAASTAQGAYEIVMEERQLKALQQERDAFAAQKTALGIDSKTSPMSASAAGGGSANQQVGARTYEEQLALEQKVAAGEFG